MRTSTSYKIAWDSEMESHIEKRLAEIISECLTNIGLSASRKTSPAGAIAVMDANLNSLISYIQQRIRTRTNDVELELATGRIAKVRDTAADNLEKLQQRELATEVELGKINLDYSWKHYYRWQAFKAVLLLADGAMNFRSFQADGSPLIASIGFTLVIVGALWVTSKLGGQKIQEAKTKKEKLMWFALCMALAGSMFYMLGLNRLTDGVTNHDSMLSSPLLWSLLNLLFFASTIAISCYFLPNKQQIKDKERYDTLKKEMADIQAEIKAVHAELQKEEDAYAERVASHKRWEDYEKTKTAEVEDHRTLFKAQAFNEYLMKGGKEHFIVMAQSDHHSNNHIGNHKTNHLIN